MLSPKCSPSCANTFLIHGLEVNIYYSTCRHTPTHNLKLGMDTDIFIKCLKLNNQVFHQKEVLYDYFMKMSVSMPILRLCVGVGPHVLCTVVNIDFHSI
jgi:hypothetical protein